MPMCSDSGINFEIADSFKSRLSGKFENICVQKGTESRN